MKAIIIDKTNVDAYISLENGTIISVPLNQVSNLNIGNTVHFSNSNIICSKNVPDTSSIIVNKLVDFF